MIRVFLLTMSMYFPLHTGRKYYPPLLWHKIGRGDSMAIQQSTAVCGKAQCVQRPLQVERKFASTRSSQDMIRSLLRAHKATA